jgi:hypothetical protein
MERPKILPFTNDKELSKGEQALEDVDMLEEPDPEHEMDWECYH